MINSFWRMFSHGVRNISLWEKRDYHRRVSRNVVIDSYTRWYLLGERFKKSMAKVVAENG